MILILLVKDTTSIVLPTIKAMWPSRVSRVSSALYCLWQFMNIKRTETTTAHLILPFNTKSWQLLEFPYKAV